MDEEELLTLELLLFFMHEATEGDANVGNMMALQDGLLSPDQSQELWNQWSIYTGLSIPYEPGGELPWFSCGC